MPGWTAPAARRRDRPRRRALPTMPRPRDPPGTATPRFRRTKAPPPRPSSCSRPRPTSPRRARRRAPQTPTRPLFSWKAACSTRSPRPGNSSQTRLNLWLTKGHFGPRRDGMAPNRADGNTAQPPARATDFCAAELTCDYLGKKTLHRLEEPLAAELSAGSLDELTCFAGFKLDDGRVAAIGQEIDHVESIASHRHVQWHIRGLEPAGTLGDDECGKEHRHLVSTDRASLCGEELLIARRFGGRPHHGEAEDGKHAHQTRRRPGHQACSPPLLGLPRNHRRLRPRIAASSAALCT